MTNPDKLTCKSYQYLMEKTYQRISNKKNWDENFKPYNIKLLQSLIEYFINKEEYEKCEVINKLIQQKTNHHNQYLSH